MKRHQDQSGEDTPRRRLRRNDEQQDVLEDEIPLHAQLPPARRRSRVVIESSDEDEEVKGDDELEDEFEDELGDEDEDELEDALDDAAAQEEVDKAWATAAAEEDQFKEEEEEEADEDEEEVEAESMEEEENEEEEEEGEEEGEEEAANPANRPRSSTKRTRVPADHLWCSWCGKYSHPDNFSKMMQGKGDDRFCLKHTGTSGFGRSYKRPKPPSDSGSEADEENPRRGLNGKDIKEEKDEEGEEEEGEEEEGEDEVEIVAEVNAQPPAAALASPVRVRRCLDCRTPLDPAAETWKTRCFDCWKNMRESAKKRAMEEVSK